MQRSWCTYGLLYFIDLFCLLYAQITLIFPKQLLDTFSYVLVTQLFPHFSYFSLLFSGISFFLSSGRRSPLYPLLTPAIHTQTQKYTEEPSLLQHTSCSPRFGNWDSSAYLLFNSSIFKTFCCCYFLAGLLNPE